MNQIQIFFNLGKRLIIRTSLVSLVIFFLFTYLSNFNPIYAKDTCTKIDIYGEDDLGKTYFSPIKAGDKIGSIKYSITINSVPKAKYLITSDGEVMLDPESRYNISLDYRQEYLETKETGEILLSGAIDKFRYPMQYTADDHRLHIDRKSVV